MKIRSALNVQVLSANMHLQGVSCGTDFGTVGTENPADIDVFGLDVIHEAFSVHGRVLTLPTLPSMVSPVHQLHNTILNFRGQL